jgi:predicted O-linked N-acetylglucosamine transferase (SPINDLY family)
MMQGTTSASYKAKNNRMDYIETAISLGGIAVLTEKITYDMERRLKTTRYFDNEGVELTVEEAYWKLINGLKK